ncbi:MAG: hypothetical protein NVS3B21_34370 [Acidimicrobiales bacterium]
MRRIKSETAQNGPDGLKWGKGSVVKVEDDRVADELLRLPGFSEVGAEESHSDIEDESRRMDEQPTVSEQPEPGVPRDHPNAGNKVREGSPDDGGWASGDPSPLDVPHPENDVIPPLKPRGDPWSAPVTAPAAPPVDTAPAPQRVEVVSTPESDKKGLTDGSSGAQDKGKNGNKK